MTEQSLFIEALEKDDATLRAVFLESACKDDPVLRLRIERLLQQHEQCGSFLEHPCAVPLAVEDAAVVERPGAVIGQYRLLEQIGEGGFGVVFSAEQQRPMRREVAVKVLKPGMDTRQVIARFEAERQALALMDHPNIAHVLDSGETAAGRPFFVMELVHGVPITAFCDERRLSIRERLALFVNVCRAVQHAHHKGVIHRDLKPSNILVALGDGAPLVKVIDFGIAKALGQQLTDKTLITHCAQMMGTPLYMSPEQAEMSGRDIDTRTDIYSLGVLLYELLTGTTPFSQERLTTASLDEIRRIIREEEPPKPSTRIDTLGHAGETVLSNRKHESRRLRQLFRGELDWIVMKALEKEPNRRYETASSFAADVQRYLNDEPVQACPPTAGYRMRKFVRRNQVPVIAASAVLVALLAATVLSIFWARREQIVRQQAVEARRDAEVAREEAETNFRRARQAVDDMYTQVAEKWLANQSQMEPVQREFLQKALLFYEQVSQTTSAQPAVRLETAKAYRRMAAIHNRLGGQPQAEQAFQQAITRMESLATEFPEVGEYRQNLAGILHELGVLLGDKGRYPEEEAAHRRALSIEEKLVADFPNEPSYRRDLGRGYWHVGTTLFLRFRPGQEEAFRSALAIQKKLVADFPSVPEFREHLAETCRQLRDYGQAEAILESLVKEFPHVPSYRNELADVYYGRATNSSAQDREHPLRQALAIQEKLAAEFPLVTNYRYDLMRSQQLLGDLLQIGSAQEAERILRDAIVIGEKLAKESPTVHYFRGRLAYVYTSLASALMKMGRVPEAEAAYRMSIDLREHVLAEFPDVPETVGLLMRNYLDMGRLLASTDRCEAARDVYQKAIKLAPGEVDALNSLAWLLATCGDHKSRDIGRAVEAAKKAVQLAPYSHRCWTTLGVAHYRAGEFLAAKAALEKATCIQPNDDRADLLFLAMVHWQLGEKDLARNWHGQAVRWLEKHRTQNAQLLGFAAEAAVLLGPSPPSSAVEKTSSLPNR